jgi:hypothetical protein
LDSTALAATLTGDATNGISNYLGGFNEEK